MSGEFRFNSGGQIHELEIALAKSGDWDNRAITTIIQKPELLSDFLKVVRGQAQIVATKHVVTCTCGSFLSRLGSGWSEEEHRNSGTMELENKNGRLYINGVKVERYLSPNQRNGKVIGGHELRRELAGQPVLCACMLDYLLQHTELIPEEWKSGYTFFWGTIFRNQDGDLYVVVLRWDGVQWYWYHGWLKYDWGSRSPAACLASE